MSPAILSAPVLIVEDNDDDFEMISDSLGRVISTRLLRRAVNGDECLELLCEDQPQVQPVLIFLDLQTYGTDGREVLARVRKDERYKTTPIIVLTSSKNRHDVAYCYTHACNSYHVKPLDGRAFRALVQSVAEYWFYRVVLPTDVESSVA